MARMTKQQGWIAISLLVVIAVVVGVVLWKLNQPDHKWTDDLILK